MLQNITMQIGPSTWFPPAILTSIFMPNNLSNSSDMINLTPVRHYSFPFQLVGTVVAVIIFIIGSIGNVLVILVVLWSKNMRTTTNCYLVSLSVADLLVLFSATLPFPLELYRIVDEFVFGPFMCSILVFLPYLGGSVSALSITSFSVERYVAVCYPIRAQAMCTVSRAMKIIAGLWAFSFVYNCIWLYLATLKERHLKGGLVIEECTFRLPRQYYLAIYMFDLICFYCLPLLITCGLYILMARTLFHRPHLRLSETSKSRRNEPSEGLSTNASVSQNAETPARTKSTQLKARIQVFIKRGL